jgi:hypothetical protein
MMHTLPSTNSYTEEWYAIIAQMPNTTRVQNLAIETRHLQAFVRSLWLWCGRTTSDRLRIVHVCARRQSVPRHYIAIFQTWHHQMFRWCSGNILAFHLETAWPVGSIPARYIVFCTFETVELLYSSSWIWFCGRRFFWSRFGVVMHFFGWRLQVSDSTVCLPVCMSTEGSVEVRGVGVGLSVNDTVASVWLGSMYDMLDLMMQPFVIWLRTAFRFCYTRSLIRGSLVLYTLFFWRLNSNRWDCVLYTRCSGEDELKHLRLSRHFAPNVGAVDERL